MIKNILIFAAGVAVGAVVASLYTKEKYETYADEAVESVKKAYGFYDEEEEDDQNKTEDLPDGNDIDTYKHLLRPDNFGYDKIPFEGGLRGNYMFGADLSNDFPTRTAAENESPKEDDNKQPYVITPEEYDANQTILNEHGEEIKVKLYDQICLTYYEVDDTLVEDMSGEILDIDETIGSAALGRFGEHKVNTVFVRNERLGADYEVVRENASYSGTWGV